MCLPVAFCGIWDRLTNHLGRKWSGKCLVVETCSLNRLMKIINPFTKDPLSQTTMWADCQFVKSRRQKWIMMIPLIRRSIGVRLWWRMGGSDPRVILSLKRPSACHRDPKASASMISVAYRELVLTGRLLPHGRVKAAGVIGPAEGTKLSKSIATISLGKGTCTPFLFIEEIESRTEWS